LEETSKIANYFDDSACEFCDRYKSSGLSRSSILLLNFVKEEQIQGRSILDLGCGAGSFAVEALKQGASSAVGLDLSPKMVKAATDLAATNSLQDKTKFQLGNVATIELPRSDIVVMDKVICCYSDAEPLLKNAARASGSIVGFVVPRNDGIFKWPFRAGVWLANLFQRGGKSVQFYLHSLSFVDETLRDSGFVRKKKQGSRLWLVFLYKRVDG
jgi:magnesium-protoporphyrin O-methyltransferase